MKKIAPSAELRGRAWNAMKTTWPIVLAGSALINLVSYVLNEIVGMVPVPAIGAFLTILVAALMMVPMLGLLSGVLGYFRGKPLTIDCMKAMFPHWSKVILYDLWEMLCIVGWLMLGMIPMFIGMGMMYVETAPDAMVIIGWLLSLIGLVLMQVLVIRAMLNYSMAQCIFVDNPNVGARNCLRQSKKMIRGYRWHFVKVSLPVFVIIIIEVFIVGALTQTLPEWLASLISSVLACFTGLFSYYFGPVMYEELKHIGR